MLFDVTELPKSIRNDVAHEFTKDSSLMQVREKIKSTIMADVEKYYSTLEAEVKNAVKGAPWGELYFLEPMLSWAM